mmetsp:Transcript_54176/g.137641  ORF Transcript_54176/g.137641 Transcript_54176/m.137641 type:complete len:385 (+) Transcript_54176:1553-2707(+)
MRTNHRDVAHPQALTTLSWAEHRHVTNPLTIAPLRLHLLQEHVVHHANNLHVPRQQLADELNAPLFQRLWHHRVVRVIERRLRQLPSIVPIKALYVDEHPHELWNRDRRVSVVELDLHLLRQHVPIAAVFLLEAPEDVLDRGAAEEVLLTQTQLLALLVVVVGVEEVVQLLCALLRSSGLQILALVEGLKIHLLCRKGPPETQADAIIGAVARHRVVIGHGLQHFAPTPAGALLAILPIALHMAAEAHGVGHILAGNLEAVLLRKPIVRHLNLATIHDLLLEETVVVADSVAPKRQILRRARVQEASRQATQATVAERRVRLIVIELLQFEAQVLQRGLEVVLDVKVRQGVLHVTANQVFRRQVVATLRVLFIKVRIRVVQRLD